jgi:V8-like Glu-specific endopeptidase
MTYQESGVEFPIDFRPELIVEWPKGSGIFVRLSEDVRKAIVYLGQENIEAEGEIHACGTGFLITNGEPGGSYLVTAAHVALDHLTNKPFDIRLNQKPDPEKPEEIPPGRLHRIKKTRWFFHPSDETVDVAVMPFKAPEWADLTWWNARHFATAFKLKTKNIGAGDFTYVVGILPHMRGKKRNMPAVHTGHIVLMPDGERVTITDWRQTKKICAEPTEFMEIDAYLIQCSALPGSSGSPVFVRRTLQTKLELPDIDMNPIIAGIPGSLWFLGVWRGAWFGDAPDELQLPAGRKVPFGFGTVVPAPKINEILDQPELQEMRRIAFRELLKENADDPLGGMEMTEGAQRADDQLLGKMLATPPKSLSRPAKKKPSKKKKDG